VLTEEYSALNMIKKNGYVNQIETIAVSEGELTELNIQLSKN
jgi:hypothetical protein